MSKRAKFTGRGKGPPFLSILHDISDSPEFGSLSAWACKLLLELARPYRPGRERGWNSKSTVVAAKRELLESGWIIETRKGTNNVCSLYALTYYAIDESDKHLEPPTTTPPHLWRAKRKEGSLCVPTASSSSA